MRKILLIIACLFVSSYIYAAAPYLAFSDLESGPDTGIGDSLGSGTIVTIWGQNLGSSQGASKVYFTDSGSTKREAAYIYYWCNADGGTSGGGPSDLYTSHHMQEIAFSIPDGSAGAGTITVEVGGVKSNSLPFTVRAGNIYYFSTDGNDSNPGSYASEWLHPTNADTKMSAGDIAYVKDGVTEAIMIGTGSNTYNGTAANPYAIVVYPGANYTITNNTPVQNYDYSTCGNGSSYWVFSKINIITNVNSFDPFGYARIVGTAITDNTCADGYAGAFLTARSMGGQKYIGNYVHDFGCSTTSAFHHTTYVTNRCGTSIAAPEFSYNHFKDNEVVSGLHLYDQTPYGDFTGTMKWNKNVINNVAADSLDLQDGAFTNDIEITGNLIIMGDADNVNYSPNAGMRFEGNITSAVKVYNNTIVQKVDAQSSENMLSFVGWQGTIDWKNNVVVTNNNATLVAGYASGDVSAASNNAWYDSDTSFTAPAWDTSPVITDPKLTNYVPDSDSPLLNVGYNTSATVGTVDLYGIPWGTMDIGALSNAVDETAPISGVSSISGVTFQ